VQHEWVCIRAQLSYDERHPLCHEAGDEGHVARQPVELGDDDRILAGLAGCQRRGELWAPVQRVGTLAGLDLGELGDERVPLRLSEPGDCGALRVDAES
jgi:hypothetical protein